MKPTFRTLVVATLLAMTTGFAANAAQKKPPATETAPPPGMNEPGVTSIEATTKGTAPASAASADEDPLAPLPKPDARLVRDKASRDTSANAQRIAESQVTKRQQGDDTVEEYRDRGHVWMIKIVPQTGPTQTFMASDGSGRLVRDPNEGPVSPVYYTLYEWK